MIKGIGTDIVEVARIEHSLQQFEERFARKILSQSELEEFAGIKSKVSFLAKRFAAKEAVAKALGTGMSAGVHFSLININHNAQGQPGVELFGAALARSHALGIRRWHLSISDERRQALAFAIAEGD